MPLRQATMGPTSRACRPSSGPDSRKLSFGLKGIAQDAEQVPPHSRLDSVGTPDSSILMHSRCFNQRLLKLEAGRLVGKSSLDRSCKSALSACRNWVRKTRPRFGKVAQGPCLATILSIVKIVLKQIPSAKWKQQCDLTRSQPTKASVFRH